MKAFTITFSSWAFALLIVLGAVFNLLIGWQIDVPRLYNYPSRVVVTLLGDAPGLIFALLGLGYALYDAARRNATRWFIALLIWPVIPLLASSLMFAGAVSNRDLAIIWFAPLALIPLASFIYGIVAASPGLRPAALAPAPRRYLAFVGILTAVTVALGALLIAPAPGPVPVPLDVIAPVIQVSPLRMNASCVEGTYPLISVSNMSIQTIHWTARSQDPDVTLLPSSGTLAPDTEMPVIVEGPSRARQVNIRFTPDIGTGLTAEFTCH